MQFPIKVSAVIKNKKNNILLIKEKTEILTQPKWNIIKGTYGDNGNETPVEAVIREAYEEATIKIKN